MTVDAGSGAAVPAGGESGGVDIGAMAGQIGQNIPGVNPQQQGQPQQQGNPAWKELLDIMPSQLHPQMRPILDKWEQGTQQRFQQHAEQMKRYEPYQALIENNVPMDYIEQALSVAQLIDENPQGFMQQLQAIFGGDQQQDFEQGQNGQQQQQYDYGDQQGTFDQQQWDISQDPRFQELQQHQDLLAQHIASQMQQEQEAQEDSELDTMLENLREQYGDYDERYVITMAASGMHPEEAVKAYHEMVNNIRSQPRADAGLPKIVSPSNGMPSEQVDVASLSDTDRKRLVQNILAQASQNRG
jgi:hypothetical protein